MPASVDRVHLETIRGSWVQGVEATVAKTKDMRRIFEDERRADRLRVHAV